jgi:hypothetical protein
MGFSFLSFLFDSFFKERGANKPSTPPFSPSLFVYLSGTEKSSSQRETITGASHLFSNIHTFKNIFENGIRLVLKFYFLCIYDS